MLLDFAKEKHKLEKVLVRSFSNLNIKTKLKNYSGMVSFVIISNECSENQRIAVFLNEKSSCANKENKLDKKCMFNLKLDPPKCL